MKINWNQNPFQTTVEIDDRDRLLILRYVQNEAYVDILCPLDMELDDRIKNNETKLTIEEVHQQLKKWMTIADMDVDHEDVYKYEAFLKEQHMGDCTCIPCSCPRCFAEYSLGIDTIEGLGKHEAAKIQSAFETYETIDQVIEYLNIKTEYVKPDTWSNAVDWDVHIPRWEQERKNALAWLETYKHRHGF